MASRIQGITVEIGGDTTKLSTALSKVNKEIRDTQSQLKDVNKLLKLDPGNTDLMAQKQKLLTQAISETKEKLDALKLAGQQANEALAKGEISQGQYDALQREIVETEKALEELEKQADKSAVALQKIGATGEKLKNVGSSIEGVGKKLMSVTAAVGGLAAAAVKVAADFDSGMSQVAAVSGATGKELDALREKAREMGAKTKFSASEAAEAMNYMAMAGWKTGDMLDGIEGIMNLAAASGEDLATTSDIVTDALTALGLSAADSGHFADILAAASSNANTNVSMMGETFKYCAPVAGALGFTAEDTAEAIGLMANAGIKSSQAGTAMRTMLTSLTGEVTFVGDAFGELTADVRIISIEFASKEETHVQFFGQAVVDVSAVQQERTANAAGNIVVPFPAGTGGADAGGDSGGASDTGDGGTSGESGSATNDVTVAVELPVTWTEDGKAVAYVTFEFNDEEILTHHPMETWGSGKHILSLYYPIDSLVPNITNTFNVYLRMENGTGEIETGACIASISGQAMAAAAAWDGKITVEESAALFRIGCGLDVKGYTDMIQMETMELVQRSYADSIGKSGIGAFGKPFVTVQEGL